MIVKCKTCDIRFNNEVHIGTEFCPLCLHEEWKDTKRKRYVSKNKKLSTGGGLQWITMFVIMNLNTQ